MICSVRMFIRTLHFALLGVLVMEYFLAFVALIIFLMIKSRYDQKKKEKTLEQRLRDNFGQVPVTEYSEEKYESIQYYFRSKSTNALDDITWHDLDMDEIYMLMNQTSCAMGEEYLYDLLRRPISDQAELAERMRLIQYFETHEEERVQLQLALAKIGKFSRISLYEYYNRAVELAQTSVWLDILQGMLLLVSVVLTILAPDVGALCLIVMIAINVITYFGRKKWIDPYLQVMAFLVRLTKQAEQVKDLKIPEIQSYLDTILQASNAFSGFRKHAWLISSGSSMSGDLADIIMDYVRILFHVDLIKFSSMLSLIRKHQREMERIYETIGYLDSMMSASSFRAYLPSWCEPELVSGSMELCAEQLYHPLLETPVKNSINTGTGDKIRSVLITGSNASGKSTFLKTLAVNAILAQTIGTAVCDSYRAGYFRVYSSMALKDDLFGGESYYMVEIKSLKRILDAAEQSEIPVLCFIDEVLRGTNTLERIAASSQILSVLSEKRVLAFAATHDLELTHILEEKYENYHFSEEVQNEDIHFDYKLKTGRAQSRNAIKLLAMLGFSKEITDASEQRAENFLTTQEWGRI